MQGFGRGNESIPYLSSLLCWRILRSCLKFCPLQPECVSYHGNGAEAHGGGCYDRAEENAQDWIEGACCHRDAQCIIDKGKEEIHSWQDNSYRYSFHCKEWVWTSKKVWKLAKKRSPKSILNRKAQRLIGFVLPWYPGYTYFELIQFTVLWRGN